MYSAEIISREEMRAFIAETKAADAAEDQAWREKIEARREREAERRARRNARRGSSPMRPDQLSARALTNQRCAMSLKVLCAMFPPKFTRRLALEDVARALFMDEPGAE